MTQHKTKAVVPVPPMKRLRLVVQREKNRSSERKTPFVFFTDVADQRFQVISCFTPIQCGYPIRSATTQYAQRVRSVQEHHGGQMHAKAGVAFNR